VKVSWDDEIPFPTEWKVIQISMVPVTTNQQYMGMGHGTLVPCREPQVIAGLKWMFIPLKMYL